jgi:hypothetical protein
MEKVWTAVRLTPSQRMKGVKGRLQVAMQPQCGQGQVELMGLSAEGWGC